MSEQHGPKMQSVVEELERLANRPGVDIRTVYLRTELVKGEVTTQYFSATKSDTDIYGNESFVTKNMGVGKPLYELTVRRIE